MKNGDQPAFPFRYNNSDGTTDTHSQCLTKREYFAAMAMQGLLASRSISQQEDDNTAARKYAEASVKLSDELLKQLES